MTDTEQQEQRDWSEVAKKEFGDDYQPPADKTADDSTWEENFDDQKPYYRNVDEAMDALSEHREAVEEVSKYVEEDELSTKSKTERSETYSPNEEELALAGNIQSQAAQLQHDIDVYQSTISQIDMNALRQSDPARWVQIREEMAEVEKDLGDRAYQLVEAKQNIELNQGKRILAGEREKLLKAAPELADPNVQSELREYLLKSGFTREEIESATDHRLVLSNYRAMKQEKQESGRGKVIPTKKGGKKSNLPSNVVEAKERFKRTRTMNDYMNYIDTARREGINVTFK